jgi:hypothetical protein
VHKAQGWRQEIFALAFPAGLINLGGVLYPSKLHQKKELSYAAALFPTIGVNGTFYNCSGPVPR